MKKQQKYDKKTIAIIKELNKMYKNNTLSDIDKIYFKKLIEKEIDYKQINKEKIKCKKDVFYFIDNYIYVKNKFENINDVPDILKDRISGNKVKFKLYDIQRDLINAIQTSSRIISTKSRQIGFTTTVLAFSLQILTFEQNKVILLFSKTEDDAKVTLAECKFMYNNLPFFLKRKIYKDNEKTMALGNKYNNSYIKVHTSGKHSGRSASATYLILDEAEFIDNIGEIQRAAQFTLSATGGKAIVLSTPYLQGSQFHNMVKGAKKGTNNFVLIEGHQRSIPQRDDAQYQAQCEACNQDENTIKTELDMEQILPYTNYFNTKRLKKIKQLEKHDIICGCVKKYYKKTKDNNYLIGVDCQEEGTHFNAIAVQNINKKRIEATLKTTANIYTTLLELVNYYSNEKTKEPAKIIIERNRGFYLIKKFEENNLQHLLLPNLKYNKQKDILELDIDKDGNINKYGLVTTEYTRHKGLSLLSRLIYKSKELPKDLIDECLTFIIKKSKPVGLDEDDLIFAVSFCLLTDDVFNNLSTINNNKSKTQKKILKNYYSNLSFDNIEQELLKQKKILDKKIKKMKQKKYLHINELNFNKIQSLHELEMLEEMLNTKHNSKIKKALGALL